MASKAHLAAVPAVPVSALVGLISAMVDLRYKVANVVGLNRSVDVSLGRDEASFDVAIALYPGDDGRNASLFLEHAKLDGLAFTDIVVKLAPKTVQQRIVYAKVVPA